MADLSDPVRLPIACTLTPTELASRRQGLLAKLVRAADEAQALGEGMRFRLSDEPSGVELALATDP